jgi:hypothetical protein
MTFEEVRDAESEARPFTDAELQRLRVEPFAPIWTSLAGLVARFLATLDARPPESPTETPGLRALRRLVAAAMVDSLYFESPMERRVFEDALDAARDFLGGTDD